MELKRYQEEFDKIILLFLLFLAVIVYYLVFISTKSFKGFTLSGHPIFYMLPFAFATYFCFGMVLISAILYLKTKEMKYDLIVVSGTKVGLIVGTITIVIGMIWSYAEWGYFWQWEARQTATLIMWMLYAALLVIRGMFEEKDTEKRAIVSAVFGIIASPSIPLSNFVVGALHPPPQQTSLGAGVGNVLGLSFLFVSAITVILLYITYRASKLESILKGIRMARMEEW